MVEILDSILIAHGSLWTPPGRFSQQGTPKRKRKTSQNLQVTYILSAVSWNKASPSSSKKILKLLLRQNSTGLWFMANWIQRHYFPCGTPQEAVDGTCTNYRYIERLLFFFQSLLPSAVFLPRTTGTETFFGDTESAPSGFPAQSAVFACPPPNPAPPDRTEPELFMFPVLFLQWR